MTKGNPAHPRELTRRHFVAAAGLTAAASTASAPLSAADPQETGGWDDECDILVCGSGAAGLTAAVIAAAGNARVILIEKADKIGGTTAKSGGAWWAPANSLMRAKGLDDPRDDALAFMARCSYPQLYDRSLPRFGLPEPEYALLEGYFENAAQVTDALIRLGALRAALYRHKSVGFIPDYYSDLPENKAPFGRGLAPADANGNCVISGMEFVNQMQTAANRLGVRFRMGHRASALVRDGSGRVVGLKADHAGASVSIRAAKGVIFATGGFTHNGALARAYLRGPIFGGCATPANTGDIIPIATQAGAALGNMANAWWAEVVVEQALNNASVPSDAFLLSGDGMILVNRFGKRIVNEKMLYNERAQVHFEWDPVRAEYPNLLTYMIYDDQVARNPGDWVNFPLPSAGFTAPYVISAETLEGLTQAVRERLRKLAGRMSTSSRVSSQFGLAPEFLGNLRNTIERFNGFAKTGVDEDFCRGTTKIEKIMPPAPPNGLPNPTMRPIAPTGPYHCIILGAGALDTKGGPVINPYGQIVNVDGQPIPGLYGAGNCIASPAAQAYWGGGATIGAAMAFAYAAARHAIAADSVEKSA